MAGSIEQCRAVGFGASRAFTEAHVGRPEYRPSHRLLTADGHAVSGGGGGGAGLGPALISERFGGPRRIYVGGWRRQWPGAKLRRIHWRSDVLQRIARLAIAAPRRIIAIAILVMVGAAIFGIPVAKSLSAGGFQDPGSQSAKATQLLGDKFGQGDMQLLYHRQRAGRCHQRAGPRGGHRHRRSPGPISPCRQRDVGVDRAARGRGRADQQGRHLRFDRRGNHRRGEQRPEVRPDVV